MVVVGALVAGIIGLPVQVVGLVGQEVPSNMVVVDLLMEAMVEGEVVGMVEVEVIRLVEVVSKGGGNCANTSLYAASRFDWTHKKKKKPKKIEPHFASLPSLPSFLISSFPLLIDDDPHPNLFCHTLSYLEPTWILRLMRCNLLLTKLNLIFKLAIPHSTSFSLPSRLDFIFARTTNALAQKNRCMKKTVGLDDTRPIGG